MDGFTPSLKKILLASGCYYKRPGKSDHEIWYSPISSQSFPVDHHIKSRHTANSVLKQAGLPKHFQFIVSTACGTSAQFRSCPRCSYAESD